jgi:hypothetical protein
MHLTIRAATPRDEDALGRLAWLDGRPRPTGRALLAERDGLAIAAVALTSGAVVADPSFPSAAAVRLLRGRRYELLSQSRDVGPIASLLRRLVPPSVDAASSGA